MATVLLYRGTVPINFKGEKGAFVKALKKEWRRYARDINQMRIILRIERAFGEFIIRWGGRIEAL